MDLYRAELQTPGLAESAFITHGLSTWAVLFGGWTLFCTAIDVAAHNVASVRASKLQPDEKTDDPQLRALARKTVIRNWVSVLVQTVVFAPFLKALFPLRRSSRVGVRASSRFTSQ